MLLGTHPSVAGGLDQAFSRASADGAEALQIFTKSSGQWKEPVLGGELVSAFRAAHSAMGAPPVMAHDSYLVNLCADREDILARSREALFREVERSDALGVAFIAFHPGAANTLAHETALDRVAESLSEVLEKTRGAATRLCIENTAGQGTCVGFSLDDLARLLERTDGGRERLGVCLDTQHLFAAGYDLRGEAGYEAFVRELDAKVGVPRVRCFHLNDSKKPLGSRVDRHEKIGEGEIGLDPFWRLVNDPRFACVPGVVELPPDDARASLAMLKSLRGAPPPAARPAAPLRLEPPAPKRRPRR
jgi:deoxyribonuclease-4